MGYNKEGNMRQDSIESINAELERFLEAIPITVHHQGGIIVGVQRGYVKTADDMFGRKNVLMFLNMLEDNQQLLEG